MPFDDETVEPVRLNVADIQMGRELFDASPDGKAERQRIEALLDELPRGTLTVRFDDA